MCNATGPACVERGPADLQNNNKITILSAIEAEGYCRPTQEIAAAMAKTVRAECESAKVCPAR